MDDRNKKQIIVTLAYIVGFLLISASLFFLFKAEPTCNDKKQNQGEFGVDCGGPCFPCPDPVVVKDLEVLSTEWVYDIENKHDIVIKIKNPNNLYGSEAFFYQVSVFGQGEQLLTQTKMEKGFILPDEEKYFLVQGLNLNSEPSTIKVKIEEPTWKKFTDYEEPELIINRKSYEMHSGGTAGFSRAAGTLINNSQYDFENILVKVVLRDEAGKLLAVNHQTMNTVRSKEHRDFNMVFPHSFPGSVQSVEVEPEVNVFNSENYIRIKGKPEVWDAR